MISAKKTIIITVLSAVGLVALIAVAPFVVIFVNVFLGMRQVHRIEAKLQEPSVFQPVARTLAVYCQSDFSYADHADISWLAKELGAMAESTMYLRIEPDAGWVGMGGGFHHYGYRLNRDLAASKGEVNTWVMSFESEDSPDKVLETFTLPKSQKLTTEEFVQRIVEGHEILIQRAPKNEMLRREFIQTWLQFDRVPEARQECAGILKALPDEWWTVLTNALLLANTQSFEEGEKLIKSWAGRQENFFHYLDLAYFYHLTSHPREAAAALMKATEFDANTAWGEDGNAEYRGYTAAMYAFRAGDYQAAAKLCDHLLKVTINGKFAKVGLEALKSASEAGLGGKASAVTWDRDIRVFDPFEKVDIAKLVGHPVPRFTEEHH